MAPSTSSPDSNQDAEERSLAIRNRKREKQVRYQRHKALLSSPKTTDSPSASTTEPTKPPSPLRVDISEPPSVPTLSSSPARRRSLSSPYIKNKLSILPRKPKTKDAENLDAKIPSTPSPGQQEQKAGCSPAEEDYTTPKSFPFRRQNQPGSSMAGSRKSDIIRHMRAKKRAALTGSGSLAEETSPKAQEEEEEEEEGQQTRPEEQDHSNEETKQEENINLPEDGKVSEPGTASTAESENPADDFPSDDEPVALDGETPLQPCEPNGTVKSSVASPSKQPQQQHHRETNLDEISDYEDPSLVDIQSDVSSSVAGAFDMRSIMMHPPISTPQPEESAERNVVLSAHPGEGEDSDQASTDIAVFDPVDDGFAERLMRLEESQEEEKKEKDAVEEENIQPDVSWDTTNPIFERTFAAPASTNKTPSPNRRGVLDMFDTSSWEETDATFVDMESQFLHLIEEATSDDASVAFSVEQKEVLEDVKRNLELASSIDKAGSDVSDTGKYSSGVSPSEKRLETPFEDEPLLFEHNEDFQPPATEEAMAIDATSRSNSQDEAFEAATIDSAEKEMAAEVHAEPVPEDEPLLRGVSSSDDTEKNVDTEDKLSVEKRVQSYNAPNEVDEESSVEAVKDAAANEETGYDEDDIAIGYISQDSSEEDADTVDLLNPLPERTAHKLTKDTPTFDAAAVAAAKALSSSVEMEGLSVVHDESVTETASVATSAAVASDQESQRHVMAPPPPPPPPPAEKKKKKKRRSKGKTGKGTIPLIAPIPEEKLKKWEEAKMRGQEHLAAMKAKHQGLVIEDPPEVTRTPEGSLFAPAAPKEIKGATNEKARSPSNAENVVADKKLAEKVAEASSAAAISFEEHFVSSGPGSPASAQKQRDSPAGGAFQNWNDPDFGPSNHQQKHKELSFQLPPRSSQSSAGDKTVDQKILLTWLSREVLGNTQVNTEQLNIPFVLRLLLEDDDSFNKLCCHMADTVNEFTASLSNAPTFDDMTLASAGTDDDSSAGTSDKSINSRRQRLEKPLPVLKPVVLSQDSQKLASGLLAANFVSFLYLASKLTKVPSPFGNSNPFLSDIVTLSLRSAGDPSQLNRGNSGPSPQQLIFDDPLGRAEIIVEFAYLVCRPDIEDEPEAKAEASALPATPSSTPSDSPTVNTDDVHRVEMKASHEPTTPNTNNTSTDKSPRFNPPTCQPSPFETATWSAPRIVPAILSFLGDPVAACRMKMVNRYCHRLVAENEHQIMQDAARTGGLSMNVRPAFWMWIALHKCEPKESSQASQVTGSDALRRLAVEGSEGRWQHVIERDVERSFGTLPPHKTGARLRTDSIVRALVTWGKNRIMPRGVKGGGEEFPLPQLGSPKRSKGRPARSSATSPPWECSPDRSETDELGQTPTDTVSDWGGVSPVASMTENSTMGLVDVETEVVGAHSVLPRDELALSGNALTADMKASLQNKLRFILHSLAAAHDNVGYCQGMDYVVAHLLRMLQDTIRWNAVQNTLPPYVKPRSSIPDLSSMKNEPLSKMYGEVDKSLVVEETVFRVMDTFFTTYNLRHMYWPELRCLKTCCRVFERLIQIKLPVLADHFEHHDLNVGLFALGWFQTLFLYLPSMPSATVCHMWDIWLVERSFKIFFRVGTAILFLSQPILLNHELEGMMTYLNTIPDATLLKPDILIACALNIKVTNRMLQELEAEVTASDI